MYDYTSPTHLPLSPFSPFRDVRARFANAAQSVAWSVPRSKESTTRRAPTVKIYAVLFSIVDGDESYNEGGKDSRASVSARERWKIASLDSARSVLFSQDG